MFSCPQRNFRFNETFIWSQTSDWGLCSLPPLESPPILFECLAKNFHRLNSKEWRLHTGTVYSKTFSLSRNSQYFVKIEHSFIYIDIYHTRTLTRRNIAVVSDVD